MNIIEAAKLVGYGLIMAALPIFLWGCLMTAVLQTGALGEIMLYSGLVSLAGYIISSLPMSRLADREHARVRSAERGIGRS
jgi:hypothetical protein